MGTVSGSGYGLVVGMVWQWAWFGSGHGLAVGIVSGSWRGSGYGLAVGMTRHWAVGMAWQLV